MYYIKIPSLRGKLFTTYFTNDHSQWVQALPPTKKKKTSNTSRFYSSLFFSCGERAALHRLIKKSILFTRVLKLTVGTGTRHKVALEWSICKTSPPESPQLLLCEFYAWWRPCIRGWQTWNLNWPITIQKRMYCPDVNVSYKERHWNHATFPTKYGMKYSRIRT